MARSSHRLSLQSNFTSDRLTASSLSVYLTQDKDKDGGIHYRSETERAGFLSCMHFFFGVKLIRKLNLLGNQPLMEDHLDPVGYGESCQTLEKLFTENYYQSRLRYPRNRKLMYLTIYKIFKKDILIQFLCQLVFGVSRIMTTYFLYVALKSVRDPDQTVAQARPYAVGLFLGLLLSLYSLHQFTFKATYAANKMKIGILGMVYRKITKLSLLSVHRANLGKILNVVTCDANNMENIYYVVSIIVAPFALFGAAGVLYYFWGLSGLVGVGYMIFSWIILQIIASLTLKRRRQRSMTADDRIRLLNEILEAIRLIKLNAWELFGFHTVSQKRKEEVKFWKRVYFLDAISRAIVYSSHWIAIFFMLLTYTLLGNQITAPKIFPTILLMTYLRQICMIHVNSGLSYIVQLKLLSDRVISIMDLPEVQTPVEIIPPQNPENAIEFQDFTGFWPSRDLSPQDLTQLPFEPLSVSDVEKLKETTYPVLSNINLVIKKGSLVMIIGKGGSGKSSLLLSFTREMAKSLGELRFEGNFEYMPQTPLFLAGSVRDNIIFGKPYNEPFFWRVVEACCLTDEINNLPNKEKTEIGERGANLNGKQKALIGLARSIYARAEIYLLDDPFSELEPELAKNVFSKAFERLLKGSTVLLVTKEMNLVRYADKIVVMDEGKIREQGTCEELGNQMNRSDEEMKDELYIDRDTEVLSDQQRNSITDGTAPFQVRKSVFAGLKDTYIPCISKGIFSEEAKLEEGKVTLVTYWKYLKSIFNLVNIIPAIILFVGTESAGWQLSVRLANWADGYTNSEGYVVISTIVFGGLLLYLLKFFLYYNSALNGSQYLHNKMLKGVMDIPLTQFAKYSMGRILNRFSIDVAFLDTFLMMALLDVLEGFCLFMVFLIALWVKVPWILLPAGIGVVAYLVVFALCNKAIGKTRNLTLATRSPLYSMFTATVAGLTTIRARNQSEEMFKAFCRRANDHSRANISYRLSIRVMSFFLDYLTQLIIIGAFCYLLYQQQSPLLNGSFVNMLVQLPSTMQWLLINLINLHSFMVSASRVINYCQKYDDDEALRLGNKKRKDTPEEMVELSKLSNAFTATDKSLLRNVISNVHIGEKVAVVGDTRASLSLLAYLNSTTDENNKSSDVYSPKSSDKIHVGDNSILFIRNSMTIITGEIHIFTASIRDNLDPRKEYKDAELWEVLDLVGLKDFVENLKNKLDTRLSKGSFVFSESQRQLLCIARAMLRKTSILIQDKATNKIDIAIDQILQKKIEQRFHNSTILTATNRLLDIAEYDKILYIKSGIKHEFAEPYSLLVKEIGDKEITNRKGGFARLVLGMDAGMSREISRLAMVSFCTKRGLDFHLDQRPQSFVVSEGSPMKTMGDLTGTVSLVLKEEEER